MQVPSDNTKTTSRSPLAEIITPPSVIISEHAIASPLQSPESANTGGGGRKDVSSSASPQQYEDGSTYNNISIHPHERTRSTSPGASTSTTNKKQQHHIRKSSNQTCNSVEVGDLGRVPNHLGNGNDDQQHQNEDEGSETGLSGSVSIHNNQNSSSSGNNNGMMFGPNRSAIAMLKQLRFSPFVATNVRSNGVGGNNNNDDANSDTNTTSGGGSGGFNFNRANGGGVATTPWQFFTPGMTKYHSILSYIFAIIMFSCGVAALVARYKTKPNSPIECDYRLNQSLDWLAGLMLPTTIFVPVWMAIFLQHVYPPLYQGSRVPIERNFRQFNFFLAFSSFLAIFVVAIFASCLYALSVAKSWDFIEQEACGYAFSMLRVVAIIGVCSIGACAIAQFIHWTCLNSKLEKARGIVRPIPSSE